MLQETITYLIIAAAVAYVAKQLVDIFRGKGNDCGCGHGQSCKLRKKRTQ